MTEPIGEEALAAAEAAQATADDAQALAETPIEQTAVENATAADASVESNEELREKNVRGLNQNDGAEAAEEAWPA